MITRWSDLRSVIVNERQLYFKSHLELIISYLVSDPKYSIWRYVVGTRKLEYWHNRWRRNGNIVFKIIWALCWRHHNRLGLKLGIDIWDNSIEPGLMIWHAGSIIINGNAKIGSHCTIHGAVCIGNNGKNSECPVIGNNVDIGVGAYILGGVYIPDNTVIGAGAVVVNSFHKSGITLVGVPAKAVRGGSES